MLKGESTEFYIGICRGELRDAGKKINSGSCDLTFRVMHADGSTMLENSDLFVDVTDPTQRHSGGCRP